MLFVYFLSGNISVDFWIFSYEIPTTQIFAYFPKKYLRGFSTYFPWHVRHALRVEAFPGPDHLLHGADIRPT